MLCIVNKIVPATRLFSRTHVSNDTEGKWELIVHLVERGAALPALPQTWGLQALEDSREGTAGPVSPRAGVTARP